MTTSLYSLLFENEQSNSGKLEDFFNIPSDSFIARFNFLKQNFELLGKGDARYVFAINNDKVIKLSQLNKTEQNKTEVSVYKCFGSTYVPEIYDYANDYTWIISERVEPFEVTDDEAMIDAFRNAIGMSTEEWNSFNVHEDRDTLLLIKLLKDHPDVKAMSEHIKEKSSWFSNLVYLVKKCNAIPSDLYDDNLGIASDGRFVIVDSGMFEMLEEANALAGGNVSGYILPLGMKGIGTDNKLEKSFWRGDAGKKIKTGSPLLHKNKKI
jgi:hypothetical protein